MKAYLAIIIGVSYFLLGSELHCGLQEEATVSCCPKKRTVVQVRENISFFDRVVRKCKRVAWSSYQNMNACGRAVSEKFEPLAWYCYPQFVKTSSWLQGNDRKINEQFASSKYIQGVIPSNVFESFSKQLQDAQPIALEQDDVDPNYTSFKVGPKTLVTLNNSYTFWDLGNKQLQTLEGTLSYLKEPIAQCLGTPWRVVNVHCFENLNKEECFPNIWNLEDKTLRVIICKSKTDETARWFFAQNSKILQETLSIQGVNGTILALTIVPSSDFDLKPLCAGLNAKTPRFPWQYPTSVADPDHGDEIVGINIGGGPLWSLPGWRNLEQVTSLTNLKSYYLYPHCRFPVCDHSISTIYTSHNLEHLSLSTVHRILAESCRVLKDGGDMIIKIPDYDKILECWKNQDGSYFGPIWNFETMVGLMEERGVKDCIDQRASTIVCSFYNDAHENPFDIGGISNYEEAYFGPAIVDVPYLRNLIENATPSQIACELRRHIISTQDNPHFCHQSAWSREELKEMLAKFGFEVVSFDIPTIIANFSSVRDVEKSTEISTFCWARKMSPGL